MVRIISGRWAKNSRSMKKHFTFTRLFGEDGKSCREFPPKHNPVITTSHPYWQEDLNDRFSIYGTDNFMLGLVPSGGRSSTFFELNTGCGVWSLTTDTNDISKAYRLALFSNSNVLARVSVYKSFGLAVRACKPYVGEVDEGVLIPNAYTDGSGNSYSAVRIRDMLWITTNLRSTKYQDGSDIGVVSSQSTWDWRGSNGHGGCCYYDNNSAYVQHYGVLYNWHCVSANKLVNQDGWRVPTLSDLDNLIYYTGNPSVKWCKPAGSSISGTFYKLSRQQNNPVKLYAHIFDYDAIFSYNGGNGLIKYMGINRPYLFKTNQAWLTIGSYSGNPTSINYVYPGGVYLQVNIPFTVAANYGGARECRIDLVSDVDGEIGHSIVVYQAEYILFTVSPNTFNLSKEAQSDHFQITSNHPGYSIECSAPWLILETIAGSNNTNVSFYVTSNAGVFPLQTTSRSTVIYIRDNSDNILGTVSIFQAGDLY